MSHLRVFIVLGTIFGLSIGAPSAAADEEFRFSSYEQVLELFGLSGLIV